MRYILGETVDMADLVMARRTLRVFHSLLTLIRQKQTSKIQAIQIIQTFYLRKVSTTPVMVKETRLSRKIASQKKPHWMII